MHLFRVCVAVCSVAAAVNAFTVLTYNAALLERAEVTRAERREHIAQGLRDVNADFVCLQEVWFAEDLTKVIHSLQDIYPYSFSELYSTGSPPPLDEIVEPACSDDTFGPFLECFVGNSCPSQPSNAAILGCVATFCGRELMALSQECWTCMITSMERLDALATQCGGPPAVLKRSINLSGLTVLSKHPMTSPTYTDFHPGFQLFARRGYIHAQVERIGSVSCTHPSPIFADYLEPQLQAAGVFDNYKSQNAAEIQALLKFVKQSGNSAIVLGDLNVGPGIPEIGIVAEHEDNYNVLTQHLQTTLLTKCTYCSANSYINGSYADIVIDHVFHLNHEVLKIQRVLYKETLPASGHHLSDHYGVLVTFVGHTSEEKTAFPLAKVILVFISSLIGII